MKRILWMMLVGCGLAGASGFAEEALPPPPPPPEPLVESAQLAGAVEGENITFTLDLVLGAAQAGDVLTLVSGPVAYLDGCFPKGARLQRDGDRYRLQLPRLRSAEPVRLVFASRATRDGEWRQTRFAVPPASVRAIAVTCDRADLDVRFPGALNAQRAATSDGRTVVSAHLGPSADVTVAWKPEIKRLESELVVSAEANTIALASIGALRLDTLLTYRVIQGRLQRLTLELPAVNVTQVLGEDIQDWRVESTTGGVSELVVTLSRPREGRYRLQVESEMPLAAFPCSFTLPVLAPRDVIRASGFLLLGTDSAIKLQVTKAAGLTQIDPAAFPAISMDTEPPSARRIPGRSLFAYQYASAPYVVALTADDVVPTFTADSRVVLSLAERELTFQASVELDIREAPLRDVRLALDPDPGWTVTGVSGPQVADADVDLREDAEGRTLYIPFKQAANGVVLVEIGMARTLPDAGSAFLLPRFSVEGARTERGHLVVAAERGIRLTVKPSPGLREVFTGSVPMQVAGAQQAFRFKEPGWSGSVAIERTPPTVHAEVFHLVSLGEGALYYSAAITYHIGGAPVQEFRVRVPPELESVEFTGVDIEGWTRTNDVYTIRLQARIMDDYTLLASCDQQFSYESATLSVGGIETVGTAGESGYIALASAVSLNVTDDGPLPEAMLAIDRDELPVAYAMAVADPIISAYKYLRAPHAARIRVEPYPSVPGIGQVADYVSLSTRLSRDGESVTTASYYLKNASRQFLVLKMPADAELWSIRTVDEQERAVDVLSQESEAGLLVPIVRPRDPNTPLRLEVRYAQQGGALGFWKSGIGRLSLHAPLLPETHATFTGWQVEVPEGFAIVDAGAAVTPDQPVPLRPLARILSTTGRLWRAALDGLGGRTLAWAVAPEVTGSTRVGFATTLSLAGESAPRLRLCVVPAWMGGACTPRVMVGLLLGGGLLLATWCVHRAQPWRLAAALGLLVVGLSHAGWGRVLLAGLFALCIATGLVIGCLRAVRWLRDLLSDGGRGRPPSVRPPFEPIPRDARTGHAAVTVLLAMTVIATVALTALAAPGTLPVITAVDLRVEGPSSTPDAEPSAAVVMTLTLEATGPMHVPLLPPGIVLTGTELPARHVRILAGTDGYALEVLRSGRYPVALRFRAPVVEAHGRRHVQVPLPENLKNEVHLSLPEVDQDVLSTNAVYIASTQTNGITEVRALFGPASHADFAWQPKLRRTAAEAVRVYCEMNSRVTLQAGLVDLTHEVQYRIAQGEVRTFRLRIPAGMSVTAVQAPGIATWSFDPAASLLEVALNAPVSGDFRIVVATQVPREGLPYRVALAVPQAQDTEPQRGSVAVAAPESIQVRVSDVTGLAPMNIEDLPSLPAVSGRSGGSAARDSVRRAYRYQAAADVSAMIETEQVLPELRVSEQAALSIGDERVVLASTLTLSVLKAGIFAVNLELPRHYELEGLSGPDVSHWDEPSAAESAATKTITVHFNRQITDSATLNLVLARAEKGIEDRIEVPRVSVVSAAKHVGRLTVSAERGVRLMVAEQHGVDVRKASEQGLPAVGALAFELMRPNWQVVLRAEVLAPLLKPEVLLWADVAEGMLQCRAFLRYRIEHAGTKTFLLQSPAPGIALTVSGDQIALVSEIDATNGIWRVDLHGKVEDVFTMTASYQLPYDLAAGTVGIQPLRTLQTDAQRGYLVVTCSGRVQVQSRTEELPGLKAEDPRSIPTTFGAGDLSSAILCYRAVRPDYLLPLSVVRHDSAEVLPATIDQARLTSVASPAGRLLTRVLLQMRVGSHRFLQVDLPNPDDSLWTALVNGREVTASREGPRYFVPLDGQEPGQVTTVNLLFSGSESSGRLGGAQEYLAPRFGLPLNDIEWVLFLPAGRRYWGFGGTMIHAPDGADVQRFDADDYLSWNSDQRERSLARAREVLGSGETLLRAGHQRQAKQAFQQALSYSQAEQDLNEDARVQLRNLEKQQWKIALVNRRDAVRQSQNIVDTKPVGDVAGFRDGEFTQEYARRVERRLSAKDNTGLDLVATKMIEQQAAAAAVIAAIDVAVPEHGQRLRFTRALQIDPDGELSVRFRASRGLGSRLFAVAWPCAAIGAALLLAQARYRRRRT